MSLEEEADGDSAMPFIELEELIEELSSSCMPFFELEDSLS